ncbi:hypothetical protein ACFXAZ_33345 [Streptomyces sp. NPDC059477]|uniref:hypothetical protein n=1 Tax=Streptomyces sp. NPDC059477 TaxID=3346847 RepID=UPI0036934E06
MPTARPHPLAEYADCIDPARPYTVRQIADLMEMAVSSVSGMADYGWLPGSSMKPHRRGGRVRTWTGAQLLRLARRPVRVAYDHGQYSPATLYRVGCRCKVCTRAHNADSLMRRRALAEETFPTDKRLLLVALIRGATPVAEAAAEVGVTPGRVYGRAAWDADFAQQLDEAGWALCVLGQDDPRCGTGGGYRGDSRAEVPRPGCRGTGCREWRRDRAQQERAGASS